VRSVLRSDLTRHTPKATDITCSVTPTLYHTDNRNTRYYKQTPPTSSIQTIVASAGNPFGIALDTNDGKMYFSEFGGDQISRANLTNGSDYKVLTTGINAPRHIDLDLCARQMYYTSFTDDKVYRSSMDISTSSPECVASSSNATGLALDVSDGTMYYADRTSGEIYRSPMNGSGSGASVVTLVTGLGTVEEIALDIPARKMYWTDSSNNLVQSARMIDGSDVKTIISGLDEPEGLALDLNLGKIYFTDFGSEEISRADLDGTRLETLLKFGASNHRGIALDIDGGKIYWTDISLTAIQRANMPEKPAYDNGYVTHAIPQCSLQYSWIKASATTDRTQLLGYQSSGSY